jgi:hypothetical protein
MLQYGQPPAPGQPAGDDWGSGDPVYGTRIGPEWYQGGTRVVPGWRGGANHPSLHCECLYKPTASHPKTTLKPGACGRATTTSNQKRQEAPHISSLPPGASRHYHRGADLRSASGGASGSVCQKHRAGGPATGRPEVRPTFRKRWRIPSGWKHLDPKMILGLDSRP